NCMLKWMDWTMQPEVQAEVSDWYGAAGSNVESCQATKDFLVDQDGKGARTRRPTDPLQLLRRCRLPRFAVPVEDAAARLWRRAGRRLQGLLRVDAGLDGDCRITHFHG